MGQVLVTVGGSEGLDLTFRTLLEPGDEVSVYIKSIRPDTRKIKLQVIQNLGRRRRPPR